MSPRDIRRPGAGSGAGENVAKGILRIFRSFGTRGVGEIHHISDMVIAVPHILGLAVRIAHVVLRAHDLANASPAQGIVRFGPAVRKSDVVHVKVVTRGIGWADQEAVGVDPAGSG